MDTDQAEGFFGCMSVIAVLVFVAVAVIASPPDEETVQTETIYAETACVDGIVQQGRPGDWKPVNIRKSKRTIPCEANQ
jgi:hypothetical protein